jgi:hypothetical protein
MAEKSKYFKKINIICYNEYNSNNLTIMDIKFNNTKVHFDEIDKAIETHKLEEEVKNHHDAAKITKKESGKQKVQSVTPEIDDENKAILKDLKKAAQTRRLYKAEPVSEEIVEKVPVKTDKQPQTDEEKRKEKLLHDLEKEFLYLGLNEGNAIECTDIINGRFEEVDNRGTMRKKIKDGLVMEYNFSSQMQNIKNFHLNNVELELKDIPEDKLVKLYIIARFFNSVYRLSDKEKMKQERLSKEELAKKKAEEKKRQEQERVLGEL